MKKQQYATLGTLSLAQHCTAGKMSLETTSVPLSSTGAQTGKKSIVNSVLFPTALESIHLLSLVV
jgi:hypothetical protein